MACVGEDAGLSGEDEVAVDDDGLAYVFDGQAALEGDAYESLAKLKPQVRGNAVTRLVFVRPQVSLIVTPRSRSFGRLRQDHRKQCPYDYT